jgi:glycosyltransferase involved in cell wall biosynthesis
MNAGVILPNTSLYGGVKRFFELGSILNEKGHNFTVFSPDGKPALWFKKNVNVLSLDQLNQSKLDILFFTEKKYFELVLNSNAKYKVFYHVRQSDKVRKIVKNKNINVFACSTNIQKHDKFWYNVKPFLAVGGINSDLFKAKEAIVEQDKKPFVILAYGRLAERRKGTKYIVKACEKLYLKYPNIKLLLFDTPVNQKMQEAIDNFNTTVPFQFILNHPIEKNLEIFHQADLFISA